MTDAAKADVAIDVDSKHPPGRSALPSPPAPALSARPAALLAITGGILYFLGFPGVDLWPCAFVAQACLVVAIRGQTPHRAVMFGFANGTVMALGGFYWLQETLERFGGLSAPVAAIGTLLLCAYQGGGRIALLAWLTARAESRGWSAPAAYAGAFVATELFYPLLFPYYAAASLHRVPVLLQLADLGGPLLVGLVLTGVNLAFAEIFLWRLRAKAGPGARARLRRVLMVSGASLVGTLAYGALRMRSVDARVANAERAEVGVVQANMGLSEKRLHAAEAVRQHKELTLAVSNARASGRDTPVDFAVWSESSVMYTVPEVEADSFHHERVTRDLGVPVIFGTVLVRDAAGRGGARERLFNTALATDAAGHVTGRYDKQYLLMFGEYLPFADTFPLLQRWSPNSGRFSPGTSLAPLSIATKTGVHRATMLICYEDILPAFVRTAVRAGNPELLLNLTNDAWFGNTTEPWQHYALAKLRAIEHRRFLVRGTNSGVSAIIDPVGRVVTESGTFRVETLRGEIRWLSGHTVYEVVGDIPFVLMSILAFFAATFRAKNTMNPSHPLNG